MKNFAQFRNYILLFISLELLLVVILHFHKLDIINSHKKIAINRVEKASTGLITNYRNYSKSIYSLIIDKEDVKKELFKSYYGIDYEKSGRQILIDKLYNSFILLQARNYKIFHFHSPTSTSFLRLHNTGKHSDDLTKFRHSVVLANKTRTYVEGFEEGRIENSFRFIYPLDYKGKNIGTVETSISMNTMLEELALILDSEISFVLHQNIITNLKKGGSKREFLKTKLDSYYIAKFDKIDSNLVNDVSNNPVINFISSKDLKVVDRNMIKRKPFSFSSVVNNSDVITTFLPVTNIEGNNVAYLISSKESPEIALAKYNFWIYLSVVSLLLFILTIAFYYRSQMKLAKDFAVKADKAKSAFLANMSHEIRTPLNGVIGMADILNKTELRDSQKDYLKIITDSSSILLSVINDILDFSKIEAGKISLENIPFSIKETIEHVSDLASSKALAKQLDFNVYIDPNMPKSLMGDPTRLAQVILNLSNNAVKFTEKGEVTIYCKVEEKKENSTRIKISVKDSGIGISKNQIENLFKAFSQADDSTTRKYGGTGLGLSISTRLVNLMEGELKVKSELEKGSEFYFVIELENNKDEICVSINMEAHLNGKHCLIIDDNTTNIFILEKYLTFLNCTFKSTSNPFYAKNLILDEKKEFDFILVDFNMPNINGTNLIIELREQDLIKNSKVVLLSSVDQREFYIDEKDVFDFTLTKPLKFNKLKSTLIHIITGEKIKSGNIKPILEEKVSLQSMDILLVEDNIINQKVASLSLEKLNQNVTIASNGIEALELYKTEKFDLIFMDIQMPKMNGLECTKEIRLYEELNNKIASYIIAMTANVTVEDQEIYKEVGMNEFIGKPFRSNELENFIKRIIPKKNTLI